MSRATRARKPLAGRRVLTTRARKQAGSLAVLLRNEGATVQTIPCIEIRRPRSYRPLDEALQELERYEWLILTSVNGVEAMFARARRLRVKPAALRRLKIAAIGPATGRALEERGLRVAVMPREYVAESVVRALRGKVRGKRVLLVRAKVARDVIPRELRRAGALVDVVEAYETVIPRDSERRLRAALSAKRLPDVITFTSSSTVRNFMALVRRRELLRGIKLASIGPVTSGTLREAGLKPAIEAKEYTMAGLVKAIVSAAR
ncbi:MAG TPA: uroporphyrinogen-III synthase [Terriglobales bacterium]|nr:uroporphyrinogen-III synthase [Terriglobales bacterium]